MKNYYHDDYLPKVNKIGKLTGYLGVLLSFTPVIVLAIGYGLVPSPQALGTAFIAGATAFGILWFVEPISYYPVLGVAGTYMAFLSGNISNMRVPCASIAQLSAGVKPGTDEGSVIATLGMAVSVVINVAVLTVGALLGTSILSAMPATVIEALGYLLPALFGALLIQFGVNMKKHATIMLIIAILIHLGLGMGVFDFLPGAQNWFGTLSSVFVSIALGLAMFNKSQER